MSVRVRGFRDTGINLRLLIGLQHAVSVHLRTTSDLADKVRRLAVHNEPLQSANALADHGQVILHLRCPVCVSRVSHRAHILLQILDELRETSRAHVGLLGLGRGDNEAPLVAKGFCCGLGLSCCEQWSSLLLVYK